MGWMWVSEEEFKVLKARVAALEDAGTFSINTENTYTAYGPGGWPSTRFVQTTATVKAVLEDVMEHLKVSLVYNKGTPATVTIKKGTKGA